MHAAVGILTSMDSLLMSLVRLPDFFGIPRLNVRETAILLDLQIDVGGRGGHCRVLLDLIVEIVLLINQIDYKGPLNCLLVELWIHDQDLSVRQKHYTLWSKLVFVSVSLYLDLLNIAEYLT